MNRTVSFILAGGAGKRLSLLTRFRAKPAVPFAGKYRVIDFTLTNCVRSGINEIYVLTQYISRLLVRHIGIGKPWDLDRMKGGVHILHPHLGYQSADWYKGTADAIYQNLVVLRDLDCDLILILSGDHIYKTDYGDFIRFHRSTGKPACVGVINVSRSLCREFGIATVDRQGTITKFEEKPERASSNLASMGIYVFDRHFLISTIEMLKRIYDDLDFGKHVIPYLVSNGDISAYRFSRYWLDIGTLQSYYSASLDLLSDRSGLRLGDEANPVFTAADDRPPLAIEKTAVIERSLICNGCVVGGTVRNSVISAGVIVERGATVENSIIFNDCRIGRLARVKNAILDTKVEVGERASIGTGDAKAANALQPSYLDFGVTLVGRKTKIPGRVRVGTNCLVCGSRSDGCIPRNNIEDGGYYLARDVTL